MKRLGLNLLLIYLTLMGSGCGNFSGKGYVVEDGKVIWKDWNAARGNFQVTVDEADAASFKSLKHGTYGKDKVHCFYKKSKISDADPATFESIMPYYAKDKNQAYLKDEVIPEAEGSTFELVDGMYTKDSNSCFHHKTKIPDADPKSFRVLSVGSESFATDGKSCFWSARKIPTDDAANFEVLSYGYSKDSTKVYYQDRIVTGADVATFQLVGDTAKAKDKHCNYWYGSPEKVDRIWQTVWVRSYEDEEKGSSVQVYRPASYKLPPSRFRARYDFEHDGSCRYLEMSPVDNHQMKDGSWSYDQATNQLTVIEGKETLVYSIEEKSRDVLRLELK